MSLSELAAFFGAFPAISQVDIVENNGSDWVVDLLLDTADQRIWTVVEVLEFGLNRSAREDDLVVFLYPFPDLSTRSTGLGNLRWRVQGVSCRTDELLDHLVRTTNRNDPRSVKLN